jgi:hypothetical protein
VLPDTANTTGRSHPATSILHRFDFAATMLEWTVVPSDAQRQPERIVQKRGYPFQEVQVTTDDGYVLALHRIPHGRHNAAAANRPVVLIVHALFDSSSSYVNGPTDTTLAYSLADAGFDVWLGKACIPMT